MAEKRWVVKQTADEPFDVFRVQDTVTGIYDRDRPFEKREAAQKFADKCNRAERKHAANTKETQGESNG